MSLIRRIFGTLSGAFTLASVMTAGLVLLIWHPETPLAPEWNPIEPLDVRATVTPVTHWKLDRSTTGLACHGALASSGASFSILDDFEETQVCHIRDRLNISTLSDVAIDPLDTRCITALLTALWVEHGLKPAAAKHLDSPIARLNQIGSYNCRPIRTMAGTGTRMSTHSTASAIDITGVTLKNGQRIRLIDDWGDGDEGAFLKEARDTACDWFGTTLGPDFNALHADHFHLQVRGRGLCR